VIDKGVFEVGAGTTASDPKTLHHGSHLYPGPIGIMRSIGGALVLAESGENQEYADDAEGRTAYRGEAHVVRPNGRDQLGLKVAFIVFTFASGLGCFAYALSLVRRREANAVPLYMYAGAVCIGCGLLGGFLLYSRL
jgi:hypothetical protein